MIPRIPTLPSRRAVRCAKHPQAQAGWTCEACGPLCPACVARIRVDERTHYDTCCVCDAHVPPICVPAPVMPFGPLLRSHLLGTPSLRLLGGLVVAMFWGELTLNVELFAHGVVALVFTTLAAVALGTGFCALVVDTARGPDELVRSESLELLSEALRPSWPVSALLLLQLLGPVVLPRWTGRPAELWIWDPRLLLGTVVLGVMLPRVALQQAVACTGARMPLRARLPASIALLGAGGLVLVHLFLWSSASSAAVSLWGWAEPLRVLVVFFALALARVTGLLLHAHAPELGFELPSRYQRPVMGDVAPTGVPAPKEPAVPARSYAPIEV